MPPETNEPWLEWAGTLPDGGEADEPKAPLVQLFEESLGFLIIVDLADYREEDVVVVFRQQTLSLSGTRGLACGEDGAHRYFLLPPARSFVNAVHFVPPIRAAGIRVSFRNGFLVAWLPKEEAA